MRVAISQKPAHSAHWGEKWHTILLILILYTFDVTTSDSSAYDQFGLYGCYPCTHLMNREWRQDLSDKCSGTSQDCGNCLEGYEASNQEDKCTQLATINIVKSSYAIIQNGTTVILQCHFNSEVDCVWKRRGHVVDIGNRYSYTNGNGTGKDCSIKIAPFKDNIDHGLFECESMADANGNPSRKANTITLYSGRITTANLNNSKVFAELQETVIIPCYFNRTVDCAWSRRGFAVEIKGRHSYINAKKGIGTKDCSMKTRALEENDYGLWECRAKSSTLVISSTVVQLLQVDVRYPAIVVGPTTTQALLGGTVMLTCKFDADVACIWQNNGMEVGRNSRFHFVANNTNPRNKDCSLEILNFVEEDVGNWTCMYEGSMNSSPGTAMLSIAPKNTRKESPTENPDSPTENLDSPTEKPDSPTENLDSPTENLDSPTENPNSPTENLDSPTESPGSPTENPESRTKIPESQHSNIFIASITVVGVLFALSLIIAWVLYKKSRNGQEIPSLPEQEIPSLSEQETQSLPAEEIPLIPAPERRKKLYSEWFDSTVPAQYKKLCSLLQVGDIVQINPHWAGGWGICVEPGTEPKVILHKVSVWELCKHYDDLKLARDQCTFYEVALPRICRDISLTLRINNARDKVSPPKQADEIVRCAREVVEKSRPSWAMPDSRDFVEMARYSEKDFLKLLDENNCSPWFDTKDLETFRWLLRQGDIVQFQKTEYNNHWAVCQNSKLAKMVYRCGSDLVVNGPIETSSIEEVIEGSKFRINNSKDKELQVSQQSEIDSIANIFWQSEENDKHHLLKYDAQKFAEYLRYGPDPLPNELLNGDELVPTLPNSMAKRGTVLEDLLK